MENRCDRYRGLNLTLAVREGILKHTTTIKDGNVINFPHEDFKNINLEKPSFTLEGQVVAIADEIAQCTHDLEDGVRSNIISFEDVKNLSIIKKILNEKNLTINSAYEMRNHVIHDLIGSLIRDVCESSQPKINSYYKKYNPSFENMDDCFNQKCIIFSNNTQNESQELYETITNKVIYSETISAADAKSEYIIKHLFDAFYSHPKQLPDYVLKRYFEKKGIKFNRLAMKDESLKNDPYFVRIICDHISGMTDQFASREYHRLYIPEYI